MKVRLTLLLIILFSMNDFAQISPPGIGKTNLISWFAFGIKQALDSNQTRFSNTNIGFGRSSKPDDYRIFSRPTIFVVEEEFQHLFAQHWKYAVALSYRRKNVYNDDAPFEASTPRFKNDFRIAAKGEYHFGFKKSNISTGLKQELTTSFTPRFSLALPTNLELRTRLYTKYQFEISSNKEHRLKLGAELYFRSRHYLQERKWGNLEYSETMFSLYYSFHPKNAPLTFDLGYVCDLIDMDHIFMAQHLALDVIWKNPFGRIKK